MSGIAIAPDGGPRCSWCVSTPEMLDYHDREWGFPVGDDRGLFEKLALEGFQSGLSWRTILAKRENFRRAFLEFDIDAIARFTDADVERLLGDAGIVRHRGKIEAVINNARRARELIEREGSLAAHVWRHRPAESERGTGAGVPISPAAAALAKDLKARGWKFVGPTTVHAFLQAIGLINDHAEGCVTRRAAESAAAAFQVPLQ